MIQIYVQFLICYATTICLSRGNGGGRDLIVLNRVFWLNVEKSDPLTYVYTYQLYNTYIPQRNML